MRTNLLAGAAVAGLLSFGGAAPAHLTAGGSSSTCATNAPTDARLAMGAHAKDPNTVSDAQAAAMQARLDVRLASLGHSVRADTLSPGSVNVNTYVHVITKDNGVGAPTRNMIVRQMHVLNKAYGGLSSRQDAATPFQFTLKSVDYTANSDWYHWSYPGKDPSDDREAKAALHRGSYRDLNIYVAALGNGLLGYATYPGGSLVRDGLVILTASMPGGSAAPYNEGDTATHELGHWFGLFHTFQDGCKGPGDRVNDTPAQADGDNIFKCRESLDSCPDKPGLDPVHNFMNYSDDPCMDRFTVGQAQRMSDVWVVYRKGQ